MTTTSRVVLVSAMLAMPCLAAASPAHATHHAMKRPDLVISSVDLTVSGGHLSGSVTVRNRGQAIARRSMTAVTTSLQATQMLPTTRLRPGRHVTVPISATLPAGTTAVEVCADGSRRVHESREANNCRFEQLATTPTPPASPTSPPSSGVHASTGPVVY